MHPGVESAPIMAGCARQVLPRPVDGRCIGTTHLNPKQVTPAIVEREARRLQADWTQHLPETAPIRSTS